MASSRPSISSPIPRPVLPSHTRMEMSNGAPSSAKPRKAPCRVDKPPHFFLPRHQPMPPEFKPRALPPDFKPRALPPDFKPRALPPLSKLRFNAHGISVWKMLLDAEASALDNSSNAPAKYNDPLIGVRVLGFLLKDVWDHPHPGFGSVPYQRLVHEINRAGSAQEARAIITLG
ncbi:hypothetical protein BJ138DRAFT_1195513, partial [Hygrophoropsis aurantiaca]